VGSGSVTQASDPETFLAVLGETVATLDAWGGPFLVFGSVAIHVYVDHPPAEDIDVLVRNEDVDAAVAALAEAGFEPGERSNWLRKAYRKGVLVDLITSVRGGIGLDVELISHARRSTYLGMELTIPAPEDLVLIAAVSAHAETPDHWFTGRKLLAEVDIDWEYLRERAALAPLRVASLLLYCRSDDVAVPDAALDSLLVH
jgi:Uncharacterised nucleotidyltransferase